MNRASDGYRAEGKTDARDARVVADPVEDRIRVVRLCGTLLSLFPGRSGGRGRRTPAHRPSPGKRPSPSWSRRRSHRSVVFRPRNCPEVSTWKMTKAAWAARGAC
ncbi:hypothetical protein GCM10010236_08250 [Streptomyces eurythermus]|nr:hypothetical protein GCM10010236_08250 [Streptomyces eurythermus]